MSARWRSNAERDRDGSRPWDEPGELRGINLRSWITLELMRERRSMTIAELVPRAEASGFRLPTRTSKALSDALRAEVHRGRVRRLGRGRYVAVHHRVPRTTRWRMHQRMKACRRRLESVRVSHHASTAEPVARPMNDGDRSGRAATPGLARGVSIPPTLGPLSHSHGTAGAPAGSALERDHSSCSGSARNVEPSGIRSHRPRPPGARGHPA